MIFEVQGIFNFSNLFSSFFQHLLCISKDHDYSKIAQQQNIKQKISLKISFSI